jgi:hypothetical protein
MAARSLLASNGTREAIGEPMKNVLTLSLFISFALAPFASAEEQPKTCWDTLHTISANLSEDFACVMSSAKMSFEKMCSPDGLDVTREFKAYIILRDRYLSAKAEADAWVAANPGDSQVTASIAAKVKNAETAWMVAGKRFEIEDEIEKINRQSAACK